MKISMESQFSQLIQAIGEDPDREGLIQTPKRAAAAFRYLNSGYNQSLENVLNNAIFEADDGPSGCRRACDRSRGAGQGNTHFAGGFCGRRTVTERRVPAQHLRPYFPSKSWNTSALSDLSITFRYVSRFRVR